MSFLRYILYKKRYLDILIRSYKCINYLFSIKNHFLYKDYAFCGFFPCPDSFLECQYFVKDLNH